MTQTATTKPKISNKEAAYRRAIIRWYAAQCGPLVRKAPWK